MRTPRHSARRSCLLSLALAATLAACRDEAPTAIIQPPERLREYVTGAAALAIDERGYFQLGQPAAPPDHPIITAARAGELARAYLRTWGPLLRISLEQDRGGPIPFGQLEPGRVFYAETPFGPVPDGFHPALRRIHGPYYLVTMVAGQEPVMIVAVSAYNTDEQIDPRGMVRPRRHRGEEFRFAPIARAPRAGAGYLPNFPEQAVERVGRATAARATHVPTLVQRAEPGPGEIVRPWNPAHALWRVRLDREVRVRRAGAGQSRAVRELYVGSFDQLLVPAERQPTVQRMPGRWVGSGGQPPTGRLLEVSITPPAIYEVVSVDGPGGGE